jgi:endonuclease YncB( thermonuclease family)
VPEVIDTATLRVGGEVVRLFGVEWARGGRAEELARYLAGREVLCRPAGAAERHQCEVDGRDLSEVVLYNGGGRATPDATAEHVAAETHARSERVGIWRK